MDDRRRNFFEVVDRGLPKDDAAENVDRATARWLDEARDRMGPTVGRIVSKVESRPGDASRSLMGAIAAARVRRQALNRSGDVASLAATARGGALLERRAALARIGELVAQDEKLLDAVSLGGVDHEPELGADLLWVREKLRGAPGREARQAQSRVRQLLRRFEGMVMDAVDGAATDDPMARLDPRERAQVMLHLRRLGNEATAFVADRIEQIVATGSGADAGDWMLATRPSADPRLLPLLARVLSDDPRPEVRAEAARSIARIDDGRVVPLLYSAYSRASDLGERLALAEALGLWGDYRGSEVIATGLADPSTAMQTAALDALFDPELAEKAVPFARSGPHDVRHAAFRALARAGDVGALEWLDRIESEESQLSPSLLAEFEAARETLLARAEMRGEAAEGALERAQRIARKDTVRALAREPGATPTKRHRFAAWLLMLRAWVALFFGRREAASDLAERALEADPGWYRPALVQGTLWERAGDRARAVAGFRRALALAPGHIARRPDDMERIAMTFARRSEELLEAGRIDVARALVDELGRFDLTRVPSHVRIALRRRRRRISLAGGPDATEQAEAAGA